MTMMPPYRQHDVPGSELAEANISQLPSASTNCGRRPTFISIVGHVYAYHFRLCINCIILSYYMTYV